MTTTSEERREVAEELRATKDSDEWLDVAVYESITHVLGYQERPIADVLADLIDPTCEVESADSTPGLPAYNLSCGDTVFVHLNEPIPSYCPYCGARLLLEHEFFPHELFPRFMAKEVHE